MSIEAYIKCDECEARIGCAVEVEDGATVDSIARMALVEESVGDDEDVYQGRMTLRWKDGARRDFCSRACFVERAKRFVAHDAEDSAAEAAAVEAA